MAELEVDRGVVVAVEDTEDEVVGDEVVGDEVVGDEVVGDDASLGTEVVVDELGVVVEDVLPEARTIFIVVVAL